MGCCCESRAPKPLRYVLPCIIVWIIVYLYISFVIFAHSRVIEAGASYWELLLFHVMTFLLSWSLAQTLRSKTKMNGGVRICRKCRAFKPDRTHHCSTCRRCVLKLDHHCMFINKCIGYYNYKFFVLFLGWSATTCLYQSCLIFRYLLANSLDRAGKLYVFGKLEMLNPHLQIASVFFGSTCLGLALLCFYIMHMYFVINNYSTLEYCEKRDNPDFINYFNVGIVRNVQEIFGTPRELLYWFVPVHCPSMRKRDGKTFPGNRKTSSTENLNHSNGIDEFYEVLMREEKKSIHSHVYPIARDRCGIPHRIILTTSSFIV